MLDTIQVESTSLFYVNLDISYFTALATTVLNWDRHMRLSGTWLDYKRRILYWVVIRSTSVESYMKRDGRILEDDCKQASNYRVMLHRSCDLLNTILQELVSCLRLRSYDIRARKHPSKCDTQPYSPLYPSILLRR